MTDARAWRLDTWGLLRTATLPATVLCGLQAPLSVRRARACDQSANRIQLHRDELVGLIHDAVSGCADRDRRRRLLRLKRDVFNGRPSTSATDGLDIDGLDPAIRVKLGALRLVERTHAGDVDRFETAFAAEEEAFGSAALVLAGDHRVALGMALSQPEVTVDRIAGTARRQRRRMAAVARYVARAATRTTPFGAASGVTLVPLRSQPPAEPRWRVRPQAHLGSLLHWLDGLDPPWLDQERLRANPLHAPAVEDGHVAVLRRDGPELLLIPVDATVQAVLDGVDGERNAAALVDKLAADEGSRASWRRLVDQLISVGLIEARPPRVGVDPGGLRQLARTADARNRPDPAASLRTMADRVAGAVTPDAMRRLRAAPGPANQVFLDSFLDGVRLEDAGIKLTAGAGRAAGIGLDDVIDVLEPVLHLVDSSMNCDHHRAVTKAFVRRFGRAGRCTDVAAFLLDLVRDRALVAGLRRLRPVPPWTVSPLGQAVRAAAGARHELPIELFRNLPRGGGPVATAVFGQIVRAAGGHRFVLNGVQSGRYKYLSRYLDEAHPGAAALLSQVRAQNAADRPLPVEIAPSLGLNFQLHPPLTRHAIELPFEPAPGHAAVLALADLELFVDPDQDRLRLRSRGLDTEIEPVHLGFLRDIWLPDELLLLRALSPRFGEETLAESIDLYNWLDQADLMAGRRLVPHRPRLTVGRLVLERERWAVPSDNLPTAEPGEPASRAFHRLQTWRAAHALPPRVFARTVYANDPLTMAAPRTCLDWSQPVPPAWPGLRPQGGTGWLVATEVLPAPEHSTLRLAGEPHATEVVLQLRRDAHG